MTSTTRKPGQFCWFNMITPQSAEARVFFNTLLGWTYMEMPGVGGHVVQVGNTKIGAIFDLAAPNTPPGTLAQIGVMTQVENVDATHAKIMALGGHAQPPMDIMNHSRMAVCADPNDAKFDIWQAQSPLGADFDRQQHGAVSWFETLTTDTERAAKFYSELFGWRAETRSMPNFAYTTFMYDGTPVAGMMQITPAMGPLKPHWGIYFTVNNADAAARDAVKLGATLCVPTQDIPNIGRFCGITSPQGITFYIIQYAS
jgi:predicted enzyme related to lactoylglutathione lyase